MARLWELALDHQAFLVSVGTIPTMGALWADKIQLSGIDGIGLNENNNWLLVCEQWDLSHAIPAGTNSMAGGWGVHLGMTGASGFAGGVIQASLRVEIDNLPQMGASSWNQIWLSQDERILGTTRKVNSISKNNEDLTAAVSGPGQILPVADITSPVTTCVLNPEVPNGNDGYYSTPPIVTLSGNDTTGGAVTTYYRWDSGTYQVYTAYITPEVGSHTLSYYSVDSSGNIEVAKSRIINVNLSMPSVNINSPSSKSIFQQLEGRCNVAVSASAENVPAGGGVEFVLDSGTARQVNLRLTKSPYTSVFPGVLVGEHTLDAYVIDATGTRLSAHDERSQIGVGDILVAFGEDSTAGAEDDITSDNWSIDGRNGPYTDSITKKQYGGFEPMLNDLLTAKRGYPHSVINAGVDGERSTTGVARIQKVIAANPTAGTWLIGYGVNDLTDSVSSSTFKANVQSIVNSIRMANPTAHIYLSKVLYSGNSKEQSYDDNLGDIVRNTDNVSWGADLQTMFAGNHSLYNHLSGQTGTWLSFNTVHHPNGLGVQMMAKLWEKCLSDNAFLVSDGSLPTMGGLWADKIRLSGVNRIGLNSNNLLLVCAQSDFTPPSPDGTSFAGPWSALLATTGGLGFTNGITASVRVESDNLPSVGATSWSQMWLARDSVLLPTTRVVDPKSKYNYDLTSVFSQPGQIAPAADVSPPAVSCTVMPASPDGLNGYYNTLPLISLGARDGTGWAASIRYRWDGGTEYAYSTPFSPPTGVHTLYYYAFDQSGNATSVQSIVLRVNSQSP
jgi:lysophospholipase L1-like esterase